MKLKSSPVYLYVELVLQPDQAASLSDIAEGSNEVRIDQHWCSHFYLGVIVPSLLSSVNYF